ncbi:MULTISPECIES: hypothetical protein [Paraburkholderia]|uniref:DUF4148 domain-containing protein n=1 Tax=Paraburkholderia tropica TaxID=92647 RepID=A0A1A5XG35_9BURK|nr:MULTISPECIES: hypothetical protein [Paraburkholderia]MBB2982158.1 hypothetical protein [Paraburkholderia tropica]MBB3003120.1 hypothetical protein [Paraburkholderia tropica]MBB6322027.1 hypothetical protein [Paraburkholderia tropica]MDE1138250.1 DUF4148 domain-containing protein [Paraburkholderia tropica]OBR52299.1 hypothetical protein A6456_10360 [Paraburkholderia tropica]
MRSTTSKLTLAAAVAAFALGVAAPSFAQDASAPAATQAAPAASAPLTKEQKAQKRKEARAQHKAERKAARAKNNAELKKLEDAGYKPANNDPNYPQNIQDAQKKAAAAAGASQ